MPSHSLAHVRLHAAGPIAATQSAIDSLMLIDDERYMELAARHDAMDPTYAQERAAGLISIEGRTATIAITGGLTKQPDPFLADLCGAVGYVDIAAAIGMVSDAGDRGELDALVLDIDSGGGAVTGVQMVVQAIRACSIETIAYTDGMMCSAAYWIGSQCDSVVGAGTGCFGSVGVIMRLIRRADRDGETVYTFLSSGSDLKVFDPESEASAASLQREVTGIAEAMVADIARARPLPDDFEAAIAALGNGAVFVAADALAMGLIDAVVEGLPRGGSMGDPRDAAALTAAQDESARLTAELAAIREDMSEIKAAHVAEVEGLRSELDTLAAAKAEAEKAAEEATMRQVLGAMVADGRITPYDLHGDTDGGWDGEAVEAYHNRSASPKRWAKLQASKPNSAIDMTTRTKGGKAEAETVKSLMAEVRDRAKRDGIDIFAARDAHKAEHSARWAAAQEAS